MNSQKYSHIVLTLIAVLLVLNVLVSLSSPRASFPFELAHRAYAQTQSSSGDIVFYPVGNQDVRRLVIFDKHSNTIYSYDTDGELENIWVLGKTGEKIQKTK